MIILKYPFELSNRWTIKMPAGAKILACAVQGVKPFFWVQQQNENDEKVDRHFFMCGTADYVMDVKCDYIHTLVIQGQLVFHMFEHYDPTEALRILDSGDPYIPIGSDDSQK